MSTSTFSPSHSARPFFFVVAVPKLIIMTFFTSGLYGVFWYLRNWDLYQRATGSVMLLPRLLWPSYFLYSLLHRVDQRILASGRCYRWSPWWLAFGLLLTFIGGIELLMVMLPLPGFAVPLLLVVVLFHMVLARTQRAINFCEGDPQGAGNAHLSVINWLWILIVTSGWLVLGDSCNQEDGLLGEAVPEGGGQIDLQSFRLFSLVFQTRPTEIFGK